MYEIHILTEIIPLNRIELLSFAYQTNALPLSYRNTISIRKVYIKQNENSGAIKKRKKTEKKGLFDTIIRIKIYFKNKHLDVYLIYFFINKK
jgi:hypothetical protein